MKWFLILSQRKRISANRGEIWLLHFKAAKSDKTETFAILGHRHTHKLRLLTIIHGEREKAFGTHSQSYRYLCLFRWKYVAEPFECAKNSSGAIYARARANRKYNIMHNDTHGSNSVDSFVSHTHKYTRAHTVNIKHLYNSKKKNTIQSAVVFI